MGEVVQSGTIVDGGLEGLGIWLGHPDLDPKLMGALSGRFELSAQAPLTFSDELASTLGLAVIAMPDGSKRVRVKFRIESGLAMKLNYAYTATCEAQVLPLADIGTAVVVGLPMICLGELTVNGPHKGWVWRIDPALLDNRQDLN